MPRRERELSTDVSVSVRVRKLRKIFGTGREIDRSQKWRCACGRGSLHIRWAIIAIFVYHLLITLSWLSVTVIELRGTMTLFWAIGFVFGFLLLIPLFAAPVAICSQNPDPFIFYRISLCVRIMVEFGFGVASLAGLHGCTSTATTKSSSQSKCELTGLSDAWQWCIGISFIAAAFIDIAFYFVADKFNNYLHRKRDWYVREFFPEAKSDWNEDEWDPPPHPHIPYQDPKLPLQPPLSDQPPDDLAKHSTTTTTDDHKEKLTDLPRIGNLFGNLFCAVQLELCRVDRYTLGIDVHLPNKKAEDMQRLIDDEKMKKKQRQSGFQILDSRQLKL